MGTLIWSLAATTLLYMSLCEHVVTLREHDRDSP